ncbi:DUF4097 family beta strand repeat-containing protein [Paenibacillus sp. EC2-1]|uniref:DUF4097 family beta strand repeat-containing protein n=1 Tax=Paenibacillus sp. EC2-1 TaxID=3388665 RepID=UPI003BEF19F4
MKFRNLIIYVLIMLLVSGCGGINSDENEEIQHLSLKDIETIHIDHGSTKLFIESADIESLEATLRLYDDGPGMVMDRSKQQLDIKLKSDVIRILNLGQQPELHVRIPIDFTGQVILEGTSGTITGSDLQMHSLKITGKSGNINLDFAKFQSDVLVKASSGNISLTLQDENPNVHWLLQTGSGRRSISIPIENLQESNRKTEGHTGSGVYDVNLKTGSGNISIE